MEWKKLYQVLNMPFLEPKFLRHDYGEANGLDLAVFVFFYKTRNL